MSQEQIVRKKHRKKYDPYYILMDPETYDEIGKIKESRLKKEWNLSSRQQICTALNKNRMYKNKYMVIEDFDDEYFKKPPKNSEMSNMFDEDEEKYYYVTNKNRVYSVYKEKYSAMRSNKREYYETEQTAKGIQCLIGKKIWNITELVALKFS